MYTIEQGQTRLKLHWYDLTCSSDCILFHAGGPPAPTQSALWEASLKALLNAVRRTAVCAAWAVCIALLPVLPVYYCPLPVVVRCWLPAHILRAAALVAGDSFCHRRVPHPIAAALTSLQLEGTNHIDDRRGGGTSQRRWYVNTG